MPGFGKNNAEALMERRLQDHRESKDTVFKTVSNNHDSKTRADSQVSVSDFKPKPKGAPRGSRNDRAYAEGIMPAEHRRVFNGLKVALGEESEGDIILQRVLDSIGMNRSAVLRIIPYLEKYGYIRYVPKPKEHCVSVSILK